MSAPAPSFDAQSRYGLKKTRVGRSRLGAAAERFSQFCGPRRPEVVTGQVLSLMGLRILLARADAEKKRLRRATQSSNGSFCQPKIPSGSSKSS